MRTPAVAGLAVAGVLAGAGAAAGTSWFTAFDAEAEAETQTQDPADGPLGDLSALDGYGTLVVSGDPTPRPVPTAEREEEVTGLAVPTITTFPRGVSGDPEHLVVGAVEVTFTFSADEASRTVEALGTRLPPPPAGLDGSQMRVAGGPGTLTVWSSPAGAPALVIAQAPVPSVDVDGAARTEAAVEYLLSLPGLPDDLPGRIGELAGAGGSVPIDGLPLPIGAEGLTSTRTEVGGVPARLLVTRDRSLAAVVWVQGGLIRVVGGAVDADELLAVAREL